MRVDRLGTAFVSSVPGFTNVPIGASNLNSLAANYDQCQAPITFTNGLRPPTQPSASNGALRIQYSYSISDGVNYTVQGNLTISTASAFATLKDQLGNPYQQVVNVTGIRTYTYLATGQQGDVGHHRTGSLCKHSWRPALLPVLAAVRTTRGVLRQHGAFL